MGWAPPAGAKQSLARTAVKGIARRATLGNALLYLAAAHGTWHIASHFRQIAHALGCISRVPLWAPPLFFWHLTLVFLKVLWRRLRGNPTSPRWSFLVELFIDGVRPRAAFRDNWQACIDPFMAAATRLDYSCELLARICHPSVKFEHVTQGCPRPLVWVWFDPPAGAKLEGPELVILYLHGGGYWAFTGRSHLEYVARLVSGMQAHKLRVKACVVDTRRAPEHPWPAPVEDAVACYEWLLRGCGYDASRIVVAGDSAGGGLSLCLLMALRDADTPRPLCAMVVSPLTDLTRTEEQYPGVECLDKDFLPAAAAVVSAKYYTQGEDPRHPLISPKFGRLHALPPVLIQAGESELLARDSREYALRLEVYGGSVQLEMYPDMPHIFPMLAPLGLEDARTAIHRQARFVARVLAGGNEEEHTSRRKPQIRVLVHNRRNHSFEDLKDAGGSGIGAGMTSPASMPVLSGHFGAGGKLNLVPQRNGR